MILISSQDYHPLAIAIEAGVIQAFSTERALKSFLKKYKKRVHPNNVLAVLHNGHHVWCAGKKTIYLDKADPYFDTYLLFDSRPDCSGQIECRKFLIAE